ncbi:Endochitinase, partial [Pseudolycoriella hygida]
YFTTTTLDMATLMFKLVTVSLFACAVPILGQDYEGKKSSYHCLSAGFYADEQNCAIFYRCVDQGNNRFTAFEFKCGLGTVFSTELNVCVHPEDSGRPECNANFNEIDSNQNVGGMATPGEETTTS